MKKETPLSSKVCKSEYEQEEMLQVHDVKEAVEKLKQAFADNCYKIEDYKIGECPVCEENNARIDKIFGRFEK